MPATAAVLPLRALARDLSEELRPSQPAGISEWLESLRSGWAMRFSQAFKRVGIEDVVQLAALSCTELAALEAELRKDGARLVQVKQLRKAIEYVVYAGTENVVGSRQTSPGVRSCLDYYESPMAAYFGDGDGDSDSTNNLLNMLRAESPLANVTNLGIVESSMRSSPKPHSFCGRSDGSSTRICSESGLPYKSPMSAFFDGDDDFHLEVSSPPGDNDLHLAASPESNCKASPVMVQIVSPFSPYLVACTMAPSPSFNLALPSTPPQVQEQSGASSAPVLQRNPAKKKSALRMGSNTKGQRVSWADEANNKAPLKLMDLLDVSTSISGSPFANRVWQMSQDAQGTFEVQNALEECSNDEERWALAVELRGHVFEATHCPHANHVLRKVITLMSPPALNFIVLELMSKGPGAIAETARHRYGCRILEGLLTVCPLEQLHGIVELLSTEAFPLCTHMYGNYVMQRLLQQSSFALRTQLFHMICSNVVTMGTNFYGSAVLGKAVLHGSHSERLLVARAILHVGGLLAAIARYRHGKAIVELLMDTLEGAEKAVALQQLAAPPLKVPKCGRG